MVLNKCKSDGKKRMKYYRDVILIWSKSLFRFFLVNPVYYVKHALSVSLLLIWAIVQKPLCVR